jgi:VCBS repeat-containing protein
LSSQTLSDVFTYTVTDAGGLTATNQVTVTIQGANDAPHDLVSGSLSIQENSVDGSIVGIVTGQDIDSSSNGEVLTYSLLDNANGRFQIGNSTGLITVANGSLLDREIDSTHTITVRVTDASGFMFDKIYEVQVLDVDEFDVGLVADTNPTINGVFENAVAGTLVGITARAIDADATNNTISYSLVNDDGGRFGIDSVTGVVTVAGAIDREVDGAIRSITTRATSSDGSYTDQAFAIAIYDVNEFGVVVVIDTNPVQNAVMENTLGAQPVGITAFSQDFDATTNVVVYSLDDSANGRFTINSSTGVISQTGPLDHEFSTSYDILVRATSQDGNFSLGTFTIQILNANESPYAQNDTEVISENEFKTISVLDNDFDLDPGDSIHIASVGITQGLGQVQIAGGTLYYDPGTSYDYLTAGESAVVVIAYQIEDSYGLTAEASVSITIEGVRDQLSVQIGSILSAEDTPFSWPISVVMVDTNGETCTDVVVRGLPTGTMVTDESGLIRTADQDGIVSVYGMSLSTLEFRLPSQLSGTILAEVDVFTSYGLAYTQTFQRVLEILAVADQGTVTAEGGAIDMGQLLVLRLGYERFDLDGSEVPRLEVQGIPRGMRITDGINSYTSSNPSAWVDLTQWNISGLKLTSDGGMPGDYSVKYRLTTTEISNGSTASIETTIAVRVNEVLPQIMVELPKPESDIPRLTDTSDRSAMDTNSANASSDVVTLADRSLIPPEIKPTADSSGLVVNAPVDVNFEEDHELLREFETEQETSSRSFAVTTQANSASMSFEYRHVDSFDSMSTHSIETADPFVAQEYRSNQETKGAPETVLQEQQSEMTQEVHRSVSLQGRIVAFWNMLRGGVILQETSLAPDSRIETKASQRSNKGR